MSASDGPLQKSLIARLASGLVALLASYGLAIVVLFWLLVLTLLGTWEQKELGLFEVQRRYFTSLFVMHRFGPINFPLPGVYLLLVILTLNLFTGTLLRIRKKLTNVGLFVVHLGMLFLFSSALVTHYMAVEGQMTLAPGESSRTFASYNDWELAATDLGPAGGNPATATQHLIPLGTLIPLANGEPHDIISTPLPFKLSIDTIYRNAVVLPKGPMFEVPVPVVNGFYIQPQKLNLQNELNLAAAYVSITPPNVKPTQAILWGASQLPYQFEANGHDWTLELRHQTYTVPFTVELKEFRRQIHPGTSIAKSFESDIVKIVNGQRFPVSIRMNEPLRSGGFTFFQASFQQDDTVPGGFRSTFAVVNNPADQWPLYACVVITSGLLLHFILKLRQHLIRQSKTVPAKSSSQANNPSNLNVAQPPPAVISSAKTLLLFLFASTIFLSNSVSAQTTNTQLTVPPWTSSELDAFAHWPIQDQGRIKPLSTFARFKLVKFSGHASIKTPDGRKLAALPWLLDTMFFPTVARDYRVIRVDNPDVMRAIGFPRRETAGGDPRTSVSFTMLVEHDDALTAAAQAAGAVEEKQRSLVQQQIMNLYEQYDDLGHLLHTFDFATYGLSGNRADLVRRTIGVQGTGDIDYSTMAPASLLLLNKFGPGSPPINDAATSAALATVQDILTELDHAASLSTSLKVIPPVSSNTATEWLSPGTLLRELLVSNGKLPEKELSLLRELENIPSAVAMPGMLDTAARSVGGKLRNAAGDRIQPWRLDLEIFFYKVNFFYYSLILFILSFLVLAFSWMATRGSRADRVFGYVLPPLVVIPTLLLIAGIVVRCIIRGRPPVSTLYETTLFVPGVAIVVALITEWINRKRIALAAASMLGCLGLFLANNFELKDGNDTMTSLVAVLNSTFWLSTHVTTVAIGYSAALLAAGVAHIFIFGKLLGVKRNDPDFYRNVTRMTYGVVCFGALFSFVGTVLGGIWANYSWGRFWGWDPKENGALAIIIWNLIILHARMGGYVRDLGLNMLAVVGGVIFSISWWGVNLLGVGLHSYGFTPEDAATLNRLISYWIFEAAVLLVACIIPFLKRKPLPITPQPTS